MSKLIIVLFTCLLFVSACQPSAPGTQGAKGEDGLTTLVNLTRGEVDVSVCPSGSGTLITIGLDKSRDYDLNIDEIVRTSFVCDGAAGAKGDQGETGETGQDGQDGEKGEKGDAGADAPAGEYDIVEVIDPCGDSPSVFDEVLLRFANGTILASISDHKNGNNTRFAIVLQGQWMTTDGSGCIFTIDSNNNVTW